MEKLFTNAFNSMSQEELEQFYQTVFMNMDTPFAAMMRQKYYAGVLRSMGENVLIGCGVKIVNPQYVSLGDNVQIDDHCTLFARSDRGISIGASTILKHGVYLDTENAEGYIEIGEQVYIGTGSCLHGHKGLEIGDYTLFAQNITITPYSHIFEEKNKLIKNQGGHSRKITIGRDCYLGKCVCVLYSADIGEGSVVGSGSVVVKSLPPYSVAVGVPAHVIRKRGEPKPAQKNSDN